MVDIEIVEEPRVDDGNLSGQDSDKSSVCRKSSRRKRSGKHRSSSALGGPTWTSRSGRVPEEMWGEGESVRRSVRQQTDGWKLNALPAQEDRRARFYEDYRKVADEYDKEFIKKWDGDLDTTLIFAGLFSAVASAFTIQVDSQLRPDPNDETAALLRVLIHKIDNTTFGNNVPSLPQWDGPPPVMVHVQILLFASLSLSLFSAFLAMLGKQWLNRYASTDMRRSTIDRCRSRQRKLDGIVVWYFDSVMESLPLMLQAALLLLCCALSLYLWDVDITIASIALCVTSCGLLFYILIVVAGATFESCPYQTPASNALGSITFSESWFILWIKDRVWLDKDLCGNVLVRCLIWCPVILLLGLIRDVCSLCFIISRKLGAASIGAYHLVRGMCKSLATYVPPTPRKRSSDLQTASDVQCISWTLQKSLDKSIHLSALEHLVTITELPSFDATLVVSCFNVFIGCVCTSGGKIVVVEGSEALAALSATCLCRAFLHLRATDPTSAALEEVRQHYNTIFHIGADLGNTSSHLTEIHVLLWDRWTPRGIGWGTPQSYTDDLILLTRHMVDDAQDQQTQDGGVPRRMLRFALHFLSPDTLPPAPFVANCLAIIAIDLGCDISIVAASGESPRVNQISNLIIQKLENMTTTPDQSPFPSKLEALSVLFSYAIRLEQGGQREMVDAILRLLMASNSRSTQALWSCIRPYIVALFGKLSTPSLHQALPLIFPGITWDGGSRNGNTISGWAAAASAGPHTDGDCQNVVNLLLQFTFQTDTVDDIPINAWKWLKRRPSPLPVYRGRRGAPRWLTGAIWRLRELRDIELLKSYFFVVWSELDEIPISDMSYVESSIRDEFVGIENLRHREDLVERLNHILEQLDQGLEYLQQHDPQIDRDRVENMKGQYGRLRQVLLEADKERLELWYVWPLGGSLQRLD